MIQAAVSQTLEAMAVLVERGMTPLEAWQLLREEWLLPPPEAERDND